MYLYLIEVYFCISHSVLEHKDKDIFHVFLDFNYVTKQIDKTTSMPPRILILKKPCKFNSDSILEEYSIFTLVTLYGSIKFKISRYCCDCHDYVDELIFNGIFPGTAVRPGLLS